MNKIDMLINDIIYDDLTTKEIKERVESLLLDYGKFNSAKGFLNTKDTLNEFLEGNINTIGLFELPNKYYDAIDKYYNSFDCSGCGNGDDKKFTYSRRVANGEVWVCKICKTDCVTLDKPNEDNF